MAFTVTIDRDLATEILDAADICGDEDENINLSFLLNLISKHYPDLWAKYSYLKPLLIGRQNE